MNKTQLIDFIAEKAALSKWQAKIALEEILNGVSDALAEGDQVQLIGFGTFKVNHRAARIGRNPQTDHEIHIAAANIPAFVAGKALKDAVANCRNINESQFEPVKRLNPTYNTKRQLYILSGNECAFPNCPHKMLDEYNHFIREICHIEAAEVNGQRFNRKQTNEQRRHISNLVLMCPTHHTVTNNVIQYPVNELKRIKADHEAKVREKKVTVDLPDSFIDFGLEEIALLPTNLNGLGIDLSDYYDPNLFNDSLDYIKKVADLPRTTRSFYLRAFYRSFIADEYSIGFDPREIKLYLRCTIDDIDTHVSILQNAGLLSDIDIDDAVRPTKVRYWFITFDKEDNQIYFLQSVKKTYANHPTILEDIFLELNFNRLESN